MGIKNEFPEDVWIAAEAAINNVSEEYFEDHAAIVIARAIMSERTRWTRPSVKPLRDETDTLPFCPSATALSHRGFKLGDPNNA
ncbi:hypothetical protein [Rhizobium sp. Leaf453]|uniref:hypothetical protein n=1 Tax=Rhizobium sp. Leaf453 TaxID=1736380 RepID=UPI0012E3F9DC|nr:hypothetical protein [Rhizobium sp. Leaf453]